MIWLLVCGEKNWLPARKIILSLYVMQIYFATKNKTLWGPACEESDLKTVTQSRKVGSYNDLWFQLEVHSAAVKSLGELDIFLAWIAKNHEVMSSAWWQGTCIVIQWRTSPVRFTVGDSPPWRGRRWGRSLAADSPTGWPQAVWFHLKIVKKSTVVSILNSICWKGLQDLLGVKGCLPSNLLWSHIVHVCDVSRVWYPVVHIVLIGFLNKFCILHMNGRIFSFRESQSRLRTGHFWQRNGCHGDKAEQAQPQVSREATG